jgi:hypothetical protein
MAFLEDSQIDFSSFNPEQLIELSYISKASQDVGILGLMNLVEGAVHRNKNSAVTGVLFYDNGIYGQILEGYPAAIAPIWASICADPRHKDIEVLDIDKLAKRRFTNWSMKFYGSEEISKYVPELRMGLRDGAAALPREILTLMRSVSGQSGNQASSRSGHAST